MRHNLVIGIIVREKLYLMLFWFYRTSKKKIVNGGLRMFGFLACARNLDLIQKCFCSLKAEMNPMQ